MKTGSICRRVGLAALMATAAMAPAGAVTVLNGSFEFPAVAANDWDAIAPGAVPGWDTTGDEIEIWGDGFLGVIAYDGDQVAELNASGATTLFQDIAGIPAGDTLRFGFAHRGRNGVDTLAFLVSEPGDDGTFGTGDDRALFSDTYAAPAGTWTYNTGVTTQPTGGQTVRVAFTSLTTAGNRSSEGNLLDAVTLAPVPLPAGVPLLVTGLVALGLVARRRRAG